MNVIGKASFQVNNKGLESPESGNLTLVYLFVERWMLSFSDHSLAAQIHRQRALFKMAT